MHTFLDAKAMAKALRAALAQRKIEIGHSESLEIVARQFGVDNWNILAAKIEAAGAKAALPAGWNVGGSRPDLYNIGVDEASPGTVRLHRVLGTGDADEGFATLMQTISAEEFLGGTLRFTAELRSISVGKGALWMRIDPPSGGRYLRFDNMESRARGGRLVGDSDWVKRSVVLDVPREAGTIAYGVMLIGGGTLWARHLEIAAADPSEVSITAPPMPHRPTNLGFGDPA